MVNQKVIIIIWRMVIIKNFLKSIEVIQRYDVTIVGRYTPHIKFHIFRIFILLLMKFIEGIEPFLLGNKFSPLWCG